MALARCSSCGRALNPTVSPNGEDPCRVCIPRKRNGKPVAGVSPVSVLKETGEHRTPEAVAAKQAVESDVCAATYKNGNPCKNKAVNGNYCRTHAVA